MATAVSKSLQAQTASSVEESFSAASTSSAQAETSSSSLETHPDVNPPKTEESTCCLVSCFVGIKKCFVGFFEWLCSLFSNKNGDFQEIVKKLPQKQLAELDKLLGDERREREFDFVVNFVESGLMDRYKMPKDDAQALVFLFDFNKTGTPLLQLGKEMDDEKAKGRKRTPEQMTAILTKLKPFVVEIDKQLQTPMLTTLTKDQIGEVVKMINDAAATELSIFSTMEEILAEDVTDALIAFANKNRSEALTPIVGWRSVENAALDENDDQGASDVENDAPLRERRATGDLPEAFGLAGLELEGDAWDL